MFIYGEQAAVAQGCLIMASGFPMRSVTAGFLGSARGIFQDHLPILRLRRMMDEQGKRRISFSLTEGQENFLVQFLGTTERNRLADSQARQLMPE